jgi:hypothetical protein
MQCRAGKGIQAIDSHTCMDVKRNIIHVRAQPVSEKTKNIEIGVVTNP